VAGPLKERLWRWMEDGGSGSEVPEAVRIDGHAEEQLRSLGYIQ
jgi:hypothetical protein